jgi:hypothetical protein
MWSALTAHRRVGFFGGEQVSVSLSASACTDLAGNGNAAAGPFSRVYDAQGPAAVLTSSSSGYSNLAAISFTATFAETVTGTAEHRNGTTTHWGGGAVAKRGGGGTARSCGLNARRQPLTHSMRTKLRTAGSRNRNATDERRGLCYTQ